jgi:uncharacterized protein (UPF0333 family)
MKLPFRRNQPHSRGQALVEFALILPLLILVLLLAIDFGRVFFGWVALNNAARIAANEAGFHPDAWEGLGDAQLQASYRQQVVNDMEAINCKAPGGGNWTTSDIPDPTYVDEPGTFSNDPYEIGDHAQVTLNCEFEFLTPLVGMIVGDPMTIAARAEFPVKGGEIDGIPISGSPPTPPPGYCPGGEENVPNLVGQTVAAARAAWSNAGFTGAFSPASGSDTESVTSQTTSPAANVGECLSTSASVTVTHETTCVVPQLIGSRTSVAASAFSGAGFTGTLTISRPPSSDYLIGSQSLVGGQPYVCSSNITVYK